MRSEIQSAERELRDADADRMDVEAVLAFAQRLVERPHQLWLASSLEQEQRLQRVFFPGWRDLHEGRIWNRCKQLLFQHVTYCFRRKNNFGVPGGI